MGTGNDIGPQVRDPSTDGGHFRVRIGREPVHGNHGRHPELAHIRNMPAQVFHAALDSADILRTERIQRHPAMHLQGPDRGDDDRGGRFETRHPALDVEELLRPQVGTEPGFGDHIVRQPEARRCCRQRVAAMGDIRERPAMDERGIVLQRLHKVGHERITQQDSHRPVGLQVACAHQRTVTVVADDNRAEPPLEIGG